MGIVLQDRPASSLPPHRRGRGGVLRVGGLLLVGVLAVAGVDRALDLVPDLGNPLQEQAVVRDRPALVLALADLADYHAAKGTYQAIVDLERDSPWLPAVVKGERTTYLAVGSVDGVVDFAGLDDDAVQVDGQAVTITLPAPRLGEAALDLENSRVLSRDRGVLDRIGGAISDSPTSERDVALLAEDKLERTAADSDLLARTEENTRTMLTGLARSFGFADVTVRFDGDNGI